MKYTTNGFLKFIFVLVPMSALLLAATVAPKLWNQDQTMYRYSVHVPSSDPLKSGPVFQWLRSHDFDIAGVNWKKNEIEVITNPQGIALLNRNGFQGRILAERIPGVSTEGAFDPRYLNPAKVEEKLKDLHARFPELTRLEQIGTSEQGRAVWALLISTTPQAQDVKALEKPSLLMDGLHHAREIMTPEVVMDAAEAFLLNPDSEHRDLLARWNVWLVPMLNVDGNNIVWTENSWWRKNARQLKNRITGVDINRNYEYQWAACDGSSSRTSADDYHGPSAASEPETQALEKLAAAIIPTAYLSYHSYSEFVLYPYGCERDLTGEAELHDKIGHELAKILPSDDNDGTNYKPGTPWQILYGVDGDSMSYMYSEYGATSFTFEINQEFQPDYKLRQPTVEKHRRAWTYFMNRLDKNMLTLKVIDGKTNAAIAATVSISTIAQAKGEKPFRTNAAGNFFKVLDPGTYTLRVRLADGRQQDVNVTMTGEPKAETVTIL